MLMSSRGSFERLVGLVVAPRACSYCVWPRARRPARSAVRTRGRGCSDRAPPPRQFRWKGGARPQAALVDDLDDGFGTACSGIFLLGFHDCERLRRSWSHLFLPDSCPRSPIGRRVHCGGFSPFSPPWRPRAWRPPYSLPPAQEAAQGRRAAQDQQQHAYDQHQRGRATGGNHRFARLPQVPSAPAARLR